MKFLAEISKPQYQADVDQIHHLRPDQQEGL